MGGDEDGGPETRAAPARLSPGAVLAHLPFIDELTVHAIADTALRARAAGTRPGDGGAAGREPRRRVGRWRRQPRGGWRWRATGGALLAVTGGAIAGLVLARMLG